MVVSDAAVDVIHVKDRYGHDITDLELLERIDRDYLVHSDSHVSLLAPGGVWAVSRHPMNQRGSAVINRPRPGPTPKFLY